MKKLLLLAILILSSAFICENIQASNGDDKVIVVIRPRPTEHIPETTRPRQLVPSEIEAILKRLVETEEFGVILRAKGMVPAKDGSWIYFDMVPGEYEIREGEPDYTGRLVVIGTAIDEHKLEEVFGIA